MRRFALIAAVALMCTACTLFEEHDKYYDSGWWVKNATDRTLEVTPPPYGSAEDALILGPGEAVRFYSRGENLDAPYFEMMMILWRGRTGEDITFEVRSTEGEVLKRWTYDKGDGGGYDYEYGYGYGYGYNRDQPIGFFNNDSWSMHTTDSRSRRKKLYEWTFEITESDLTPPVEP